MTATPERPRAATPPLDRQPPKGGRPTKYSEATVRALCDALSDGMPQRGACVAAGISEKTLAEWLKAYPQLSDVLETARERARFEALKGIKTAGERDWRATESWLKLTFPGDYRGSKVEVNANATAHAGVFITAERQRELQAARAAQLSR